MSVNAQIQMLMRGEEVIPLGLDNAGDARITHTIGAAKHTLGSATPVDAEFSDTVNLSAGAAALDLAALVRGSQLANLDLTGKKVQAVHLKTPAANTAAVTVEPASVNGYNLLGASTGEVALPPGSELLLESVEQLPDVGASAKDVDFTSSDVDAAIDVHLVAG